MSKRASSPAPDSDALLQEGQTAQDAYDYEGAQTLYQRAFELSQGAPLAALALLTLLVDNLAADGETLRLLPALAPEAQAHPEVRVLGALAAARAGQPELAQQLLRGATHPRAAEVYGQLCQDACTRGALDEAARYLAQAREHNPVYPELPRLTAQLRHQQEDARLPLEIQLLDLVKDQATEPERAEALARQILSRWPDSDPARRLLAEFQDRRRTQSALGLLAQAEAAVTAGQRPRALALLHEALAGAPPAPLREQLQARLQRLSADEQAQHETQQVESCVALLAGENEAAGLLAYLALPAGLRERSAAQASAAALRAARSLALLEELGARATAHPQAAIDAVLALWRVQGEDDELQDAAAALQLLGRHQRFLDHLALGRRARRAVEDALAAKAREQARAVVAAATAAHQRGESEAALTLLAGLRLRDLPALEQRGAEQLREVVQVASTAQEGSRRVAALLVSGAALQARALAEQLLARAPAGERERLATQLQQAQTAVQRAFLPCSYHEPPPAAETLGVVLDSDGSNCALLPDGAVLLAKAQGRWLFLWEIDAHGGAVRRRAHLVTPEPLGSLQLEVNGQTLWFLGHDSGALQVGWPELTVLRWIPAAVLHPHGFQTSRLRISPDGRRLWIVHRDRSFDAQVHVVDLERPEEHRDLGSRSDPWPIPDAQRPLMACARNDDLLCVHDCRGNVVFTQRLPEPEEFRAAVVHPSGTGMLVLTAVLNEELGWIEVSPEGELGPLQRIHDGAETSPWSLGTALAAQMSFILFGHDDVCELLALQAQAGGPLREAYRVPVPEDVSLVCDGASRRVFAIYGRSKQLQPVELGPRPPRFAADAQPAVRWFTIGATHRCDAPSEHGYAPALAVLEHLKESARERWTNALQLRWGHSTVAERLDLVRAAKLGGAFALADTLQQRLVETHPDHPEVRLLQAEVAGDREDWAELRRLLEPVHAARAPGLPGPVVQHVQHLLALALLFLGESEQSRQVLAEAEALGGGCDLGDLQALLAPLPDVELEGAQSPVRGLRRAIAEAVRCLARDDWQGAHARLDIPLVWLAEERQSLARLVQALLAAPPPQGVEVFALVRALSSFCATAQHKPRPRELPLDADRLSEAEIDALLVQAQSRLDQLCITAAAAPPR